MNTIVSDTSAREQWLIDRLHYAIQFYIWADATKEDVAKLIDSLSDSDEYDDKSAALVQIPRYASAGEAQQAVDAILASLPSLSGEWEPIETAPKDGTVFIARYAEHPSFGSWAMLRRVRYLLEEGEFRCVDLGTWLHVAPIEPDYEHGSDTPEEMAIPFAFAPDDLNESVRYQWRPLPAPPAMLSATPSSDGERGK